jgi:N-acetylmuramoyl-L-alanine amidase
MPRVLISAGHTIMDPGAIFGDLREADITRKIAAKVLDALQPSGLEVKAVPLDLPINDRIQWINNSGFNAAGGDILVEIHINDSDGSKRGLEIWYEGNGNNESQKVAVCIADAVVTKHSFENQGVRSEYDHDLGSLRFLNQTAPHAVIAEVLFIDNQEDIAILKDDAQLTDIAKSIASGIAHYCGKDLAGQELAAIDKPDYSKLVSTYVKTNTAGDVRMNPFSLDGLGGIPANPTAPALKPFSAPNFTAPVPLQSAPSLSPNPATTPNFGAPASFGGIGSSFSGPTPGGFGGNQFMDREKRKEMIEKTYERILGKKPNQNDLNNYLNKGVTDAELTQKLLESEDHAELIKAKEELDNIKKQQGEAESKIARLQATLRDMQDMITQLNRLLAHKNSAINQMEQTFAQQKGLPSQVYSSIQSKQAHTAGTPKTASSVKLQASFAEKLYRKFAKRFS